MGWVKIIPCTNPNELVSPVRVSVRKKRPGLGVCVVIDDDLLARLGWAPGDKIGVTVGTDENLGQMVLAKCPRQSVTLGVQSVSEARGIKYFGITCRLWLDAITTSQRAKPCDYQVNDGPPKALLVHLPRWAGRPPLHYEDEPRATRGAG